MPTKSYIEPKDIPTEGFQNFQSIRKAIKFGELAHADKTEVVVVKETFLLRNGNGKRVGVVTRSSKDHEATVGDCSILLSSDFLNNECREDNQGKIYYDVNDRLHEHIGPMSSMFHPAKSQQSLLIHYLNPRNNRRYIFVVFEMICDEEPAPMYTKLRTRQDDAFIGFHDVSDVAAGLKKYNKTPIEVDERVLQIVKPKKFFRQKGSSVLNLMKLETKNSIVSQNITLLKVNIFGVG